MKNQIKRTLILRREGRLYEVIVARRAKGNWWTFECKDLETRQNRIFKHQMLGMLEAMDAAASTLKDPKDILLIDLDNQGKWKTMRKDETERALRLDSS